MDDEETFHIYIFRTWFIRCIYYLDLQFLNYVIIVKTKASSLRQM